MEKKLQAGLIREENPKDLKKGFYHEDELLKKQTEAQIALTDDNNAIYFPPQAEAFKYVDQNGTERVLLQPFNKGEEVSVINQKNFPANPGPLMREHITTSIPDEFTGMLFRNPDTGKKEKITNFLVHPVEVVEVMHGETLKTKLIRLRVNFYGKVTMLETELSKINQLGSLIENEVIGAVVTCHVYNAHTKLAQLVRQELSKVLICVKQTRPGWGSYGGKKVFFHDLHKGLPDSLHVETGKAILADSSFVGQEFLILQRLLEMGTAKIMAPMIAVALLGPLYDLYRNANVAYAPTFALFINGRSGSLKTAVSKVIYNFYNADQPIVPASFQDTPTAMEKRLAEYASVPLLIDDFFATGLGRERGKMEKLLEQVVRFVGDGIGKNRSNGALQDVKGTRPTGMAVITGEDTAGQLSTLLRCLILNVDRKTFNPEVLTEFQNSPLMWSTFAASFINFLEENYDSTVTYIRSNYLVKRKGLEDIFQDRRPADQLTQLELVFEILRYFLRTVTPPDIDVDGMCDLCMEGCREAVLESQRHAEENSAETLFCFALAQALATERIILAENKEAYICKAEAFDGFKTEEFYFLVFDRVYAKIRKIFMEQGRELSLDTMNAKRSLDKAGLLVNEVENKGTEKERVYLEVKVLINGKRPRMLKLLRGNLDAFMDKN